LVKSGENGYLVPVDDVETTSQVIKKLISSPELRNSMQEKNKEKARAYALDRILPQMEKIYEYILKT